MGLAISHIAWPISEERSIAQLLRSRGVTHVEVAPPKIFQDPANVADSAATTYLEFWLEHGISISSMQSLLFGKPELQLFGNDNDRELLLAELKGICHLAGNLGASRLVFGSPKNRRRPLGLKHFEAEKIAAKFFRQVGEYAVDNGAVFCIEPNPKVYGCNFVTSTRQGINLVERTDHPGFGLHLDAAGMTLSKENVTKSITYAGEQIKHFHVSAPNLGPLDNSVDHSAISSALQSINYQGKISIEMKEDQSISATETVTDALDLVVDLYSPDFWQFA